MGPQLYRLFYQPIASASTLVLLIVSIAVHLALVGLGLLAFGAEGARTAPFSDASLTLGPLNVNSQALWVLAVSAVLIIVLYQFFERSMYGKALRAAAFNRLGARLMGISPIFAGKATFFLAALIGTVSGILIAPITTMYFDSGFMVSLKGFVGAIIGGLVSYPLAAAGCIAGRPHRSLLLVLGKRLQRNHRVHADHPRAALAFTEKPSRRGRRRMNPRHILLAFLALLALAPLVLPPFYVTLLNYIGLYAMVALGLVLLTGVGGLTSFGQAAFVGVGAYTTALLTTRADTLPSWLAWLGASPWLTLLAGLALTLVIAYLLGAITLKLSGHFLPLGTIAWGLSLYFVFGSVEGLGGHTGIPDIPAIHLSACR